MYSYSVVRIRSVLSTQAECFRSNSISRERGERGTRARGRDAEQDRQVHNDPSAQRQSIPTTRSRTPLSPPSKPPSLPPHSWSDDRPCGEPTPHVLRDKNPPIIGARDSRGSASATPSLSRGCWRWLFCLQPRGKVLVVTKVVTSSPLQVLDTASPTKLQVLSTVCTVFPCASTTSSARAASQYTCTPYSVAPRRIALRHTGRPPSRQTSPLYGVRSTPYFWTHARLNAWQMRLTPVGTRHW